MSRTTLFLILMVLLLGGGAIFLSMSANEVPTETIEVDVSRDSTSR